MGEHMATCSRAGLISLPVARLGIGYFDPFSKRKRDSMDRQSNGWPDNEHPKAGDCSYAPAKAQSIQPNTERNQQGQQPEIARVTVKTNGVARMGRMLHRESGEHKDTRADHEGQRKALSEGQKKRADRDWNDANPQQPDAARKLPEGSEEEVIGRIVSPPERHGAPRRPGDKAGEHATADGQQT